MLAVVAVIVLVLAAVVAVLVVNPFGRGNDAQPIEVTATYGSDDVLVVSSDTVIRPLDKDGTLLDSYTVSVQEAQDADGNDVSVSGGTEIAAGGGEGFTAGTLIAGIPDAVTVWATVSDGAGEEFDLPPIQISEGASSDPIAIGAKSGTEDGSSSDAAAQDVTGKEIVETVQVPTFNYGSTSDGTEGYLWSYVRLSGGDKKVTDKLNKQFKSDYDEQKSKALNFSLDDMDINGSMEEEGDCVSYRSALTYVGDSYAAVRLQRYMTMWGAHGSTFMTGTVYDLSTGKKVDVTKVAGMSRDELDAQAASAVQTFIQSNPDKVTADQVPTPEEIVSRGTYLVTEEGITIYTADYDMGTYADGNREILVVPFDESMAAGTDVTMEHTFGSLTADL